MMSHRNIFVFFSVVVLLLAACEEAGPPPSTVPPADARFLEPEYEPMMIVNSVLAAKGDEKKRAAAAQWADLWIAEPGWFGAIDRLSEEKGRTVAWIKYTGSPIMGGSFLVGVDVVDPNGRELKAGREIEFTGRIEKVEYGMVGPIPEFKIVVRNGKILKLGGK
ncbi:MAG: hypothetical protein H7210_00440 [Pyrinomonadaceae bacterium]|nr:hypothetical protein [Phycisphaerales bacterium]